MNHMTQPDGFGDAPWDEKTEEELYEENRCEQCSNEITLGTALEFKADTFDAGVIICEDCQRELIREGYSLKNFTKP